MTGYYTVAIPPPKLSAGTRPFELKKEAKYNLFTLNPSGMEKTFLPDPGCFIHRLILYLCAFCFWYFLYLSFSTLYFSSLWRSPSQIPATSILSPTPSNVFEINETIGGLIEDLLYFSTWKWFIRGHIVVNR